jgi:hypothetical protein
MMFISGAAFAGVRAFAREDAAMTAPERGGPVVALALESRIDVTDVTSAASAKGARARGSAVLSMSMSGARATSEAADVPMRNGRGIEIGRLDCELQLRSLPEA